MDVIESFLVEIGLDPSKFTKGQQEALDSFKHTQDQAKKMGDSVEAHGDRSAQALSRVRTQVLALGAAFLGAQGVKQFVEGQVKANTQTGRLSVNVGVAVRELSAWERIAERSGGTSEGVASSFEAINEQVQKFLTSGEGNLPALFKTLAVEGGKVVTMNMPLTEMFKNIAEDLKNITEKSGSPRANYFGRLLGIDPAFVAVLAQGRVKIEDLLRTQKDIGEITQEDVDAAKRLTAAWNETSQAAQTFGTQLITGLEPALTGVLKAMSNIETQLPKDWDQSKPQFKALAESVVRIIVGPQAASQMWDSSAWSLNGGQGHGGKGGPGQSSGGLFSGLNDKLRAAAVAGYIREQAPRWGISPDQALAVARSEGLNSYVGDRGSSFGPFQLHYGNVASGGMAVGGLGDDFTKKTGLDARDPSTTKQQIDFALEYASKNGWGAWHGWRGAPFAGISSGGGGSTHTSSIHIDNVAVHTAAKDADGIARDFGAAVRRNTDAMQGNYGAN